jgi:hypothetical protein
MSAPRGYSVLDGVMNRAAPIHRVVREYVYALEHTKRVSIDGKRIAFQ